MFSPMTDLPILGFGYLLMGVLLSIDVLLFKHRPVSAVLWLAVVWAFPYIGALAYLGFGVDRVRTGAAARAASKRLVAQKAALNPALERLIVGHSSHDLPASERHPAQHILRATDPAVRQNRVWKGNSARLMVDGDEFYPSLFDAVANAKSSVHLQTYIFRRDRVGGELRDLLSERARAGIEVRLLYDRFGSTRAHYSRFFVPARKSGVHASSISQANVLKGRFQINLRNHRKIAVIDGKKGFAGGINIHDENLAAYTEGSPIRDYHVELEGPAVSDLQFQFIEDWHFATGEPPERLMEPRYFPEVEPVGAALIQIVPGGPERMGHGLADAYFGAIVAADKSVSIVTPYFVPDEPVVQALRYAAVRGVDVKLVVPQRNNHWYTGFAARSLYTPLLRAGVRIFERHPPFIHAKALLVDGVYAMLGSANLDYRSLHLNFETNIEIVHEEFVRAVEDQINLEIERSDEVTPEKHQARSLPRRLTENFCRLFEPML